MYKINQYKPGSIPSSDFVKILAVLAIKPFLFIVLYFYEKIIKNLYVLIHFCPLFKKVKMDTSISKLTLQSVSFYNKQPRLLTLTPVSESKHQAPL